MFNIPVSPDLIHGVDIPAPVDQRPHVGSRGGGSHWFLREDAHQWLLGRDVRYGMECRDSNSGFERDWRWVITIQDAQEAALFKLTWGGR